MWKNQETLDFLIWLREYNLHIDSYDNKVKLFGIDSVGKSWNERDIFMAKILLNIRQYEHQAKTVVWAHNLHTGDARATSAVEQGQINLSQLLRERHPEKVYSIGMFTYIGDVIASNEWGQKTIKKQLKLAHFDSVEHLLNMQNEERFYIIFNNLPSKVKKWLNRKRLQRHVGVVYIDDNELENHYADTQIVNEFDSIIFFNRTTALNWLNHW